ALSRERSITHKRGQGYVRARCAERMARAPARPDLDRDGRHRLDSKLGRPDRGDSQGRCYLDSTGSETLARRYAEYRHDAHRDTGTAQWQSRGVDGEGHRGTIPQVILALPELQENFFLPFRTCRSKTQSQRLQSVDCREGPPIDD